MPEVAECRYCDRDHAPTFLCDPAKKVLDALYARGQRFDLPVVEFPEPIAHAGMFGPGTVAVAGIVVKAAIVPVAEIPRPALIFTGTDSDGTPLPNWIYVGAPQEIKRIIQLVSDMGLMAIRRARGAA